MSNFLIFQWQPTWITIKADGQIDGKPNDSTAEWSSVDGGFMFTIPAELGARLSHGRSWEILEIQSMTSGLIVSTFPYGTSGLLDAKPILTLATGERSPVDRLFAAKEEVSFKTDGPTDIRILVREYNPNNKGS